MVIFDPIDASASKTLLLEYLFVCQILLMPALIVAAVPGGPVV